MSKIFVRCVFLCAVSHIGMVHCFFGTFVKRVTPALTAAVCVAGYHEKPYGKPVGTFAVKPIKQQEPEYPIVFHPSYDIKLLFGIDYVGIN